MVIKLVIKLARISNSVQEIYYLLQRLYYVILFQVVIIYMIEIFSCFIISMPLNTILILYVILYILQYDFSKQNILYMTCT